MWDRAPGLLGWAFRPRNFMKNRCLRWGTLQPANRPQGRGFSTLPMRQAYSERRSAFGIDRPGGLSYLQRPQQSVQSLLHRSRPIEVRLPVELQHLVVLRPSPLPDTELDCVRNVP